MSTATAEIPRWKQAIIDRKKQKEDEEKRKKEEEDAYLKSLPPWKRAMLQKKSGKQQGGQKPQEPKVSPNVSSTSNAIKPSWQKEKAVQLSNGPSTPPPPTVENVTQNVRGPENSPSTAKDIVALWSKETSPSNSFVVEADQRSRAPNSVEEKQKPETNDSEQGRRSPFTANNLVITRKGSPQVNTSQVGEESPNMRKRSKSESCLVSKPDVDPEVDDTLASLPAWRRELILRKRRLKRTNTPPKDLVTEQIQESTKSTAAGDSTEQKPRTHQAQPVKGKEQYQQPPPQQKQEKQQQQLKQPQQHKQPQQPKQQQQQQQKQQQQPKQQQQQKQPQQKQQPKPQHKQQEQHLQPRSAVHNKETNASEKKEPTNVIELVPPAFKEIEPWADMSEDDPIFKALPPWKQALILRRRDDFKRRSCPHDYLKAKAMENEPQEEEEEVDCPPEHITTIWSPTNTNSLKHIAKESSHKSEDEEEKLPPWKLDILRNQRLKAHLEGTKESESTSAHHQLPVNSPEEEDDDDETMFTNIDDIDSDSEEILKERDTLSGLNQNYSVSSSTSSLSSSSGGKSILLHPEKRRTSSGMKNRRVSWNEDQIITEFSYPKYDYKDYNEDLPDGVIDTKLRRTGMRFDDGTPSQPIHPSLRMSPPPSSPTGEESINYGGSPNGSLSSYKPSILSTFASFGEPWASTTSMSYEPDTADKNVKTEEKEAEMPAEDLPVDGWDQNPGAMLW